jgi:outer membrane protein OmpA-like peptidoglycan-associated protein
MDDDKHTATTDRTSAGRFRKGTSGNPGGRSGKSAQMRKKLEGGAADAVKTIIEAAKEGDMQACRLILERVVPASKPVFQPVTFDLDDSDLSAAARSILRAVAGGTLPADQGKTLLDGLASVAKVIEVTELREMVERLEKQIEGGEK